MLRRKQDRPPVKDAAHTTYIEDGSETDGKMTFTGTVMEKCRVYGDLRANFIPRRKHLDSGWFNAIT